MNYLLKRRLILLIFFFAPTGMMFLPFPFVGSFRLFYIFCAFLCVVELYRTPSAVQVRWSLLFVIATCFSTSAVLGVVGPPKDISLAQNPYIRVSVICTLMFAFYAVAVNFCRNGSLGNVEKHLSLSYWGFFLTFFVGTTVYIGSLTGLLPASFYTHIVSLEQVGYGYLRLSPGTYPNEFGVLCSFFSIFAVMRYVHSRKILDAILAVIYAAGIFLTSTRTAYITFAVSFLTLVLFYPGLKSKLRLALSGVIAVPIVLGALTALSFNVLKVIEVGYQAAFNSSSGSAAKRRDTWAAAADYFSDHVLFGMGFESPQVSFMHNLPLQVGFGLGAVGLLIVGVLLLFFWYLQSNDTGALLYTNNRTDKSRFLLLRLVLLEHVLLFGLTNHNQAHYLTWLLFSLFCLKVKVRFDQKVDYSAEKLTSRAGSDRYLPSHSFSKPIV